MVDDGGLRIRRREIEACDLAGVMNLLGRGFPARPRRYWECGLRRMGERPALEGCPRHGFLLEAGGDPIGVALMLCSAVAQADGFAIRCNLSSWTVDPAFRMQAPLLIASMLKRRDIIFTNISPAAHTLATIEAQGFRAYAKGQVLVDRNRCMCRLLPCPRGLPRYSGGSASTPSLSRPARASLALRPAGSLNRPRRPLSQGFNPAGCPTKSPASYQINRQLSGRNLPPLVTYAVGAH